MTRDDLSLGGFGALSERGDGFDLTVFDQSALS